MLHKHTRCLNLSTCLVSNQSSLLLVFQVTTTLLSRLTHFCFMPPSYISLTYFRSYMLHNAQRYISTMLVSAKKLTKLQHNHTRIEGRRILVETRKIELWAFFLAISFMNGIFVEREPSSSIRILSTHLVFSFFSAPSSRKVRRWLYVCEREDCDCVYCYRSTSFSCHIT